VRKNYIAGNWKMNLDRRSGVALAQTLAARSVTWSDRDVALFPPFVYIGEIARAVAGSSIQVGGQNVSDEKSGAFTGEVSAAMLKDVGATIALCGHSERRHLYGEDDRLVNRKLHAALSEELDVILCVGETADERQSGATEQRISRQLTLGLAGVAEADLARVTLAYEPVWAIGTGNHATPEQVGEVHSYLRGLLSGLFSDAAANRVRIQYGGSVKADNIQALMRVPDVDGALVGGACLKSEAFLPIVEVAL
jgi:triosephosphate isomerase